MKRAVPAHLLKAFVDQGLVPTDCSELEIELPAGGMLALHYTVFLHAEHLPKLAAAFAAMHDEMAADDQHREETIQTENAALLIRARDRLSAPRAVVSFEDAKADCTIIRELMDALQEADWRRG